MNPHSFEHIVRSHWRQGLRNRSIQEITYKSKTNVDYEPISETSIGDEYSSEKVLVQINGFSSRESGGVKIGDFFCNVIDIKPKLGDRIVYADIEYEIVNVNPNPNISIQYQLQLRKMK